MLSRHLGAWLGQIGEVGDHGHHRIISNEIEDMRGGKAAWQHHANLNRLNCQLCVASSVGGNLATVFLEKRGLGSDLEEASRTILDKLAEVRAIVGLDRLGFEDIRFTKNPDLLASLEGKSLLVEVTRFGTSQGNRSKETGLMCGMKSGAH
jgi:hypothetical protein